MRATERSCYGAREPLLHLRSSYLVLSLHARVPFFPPPGGLQATYDIFQAATAYCQPGRPYSGIGGVIQEMVDAQGYSTISNFCETKLRLWHMLGSALRGCLGGGRGAARFVGAVTALVCDIVFKHGVVKYIGDNERARCGSEKRAMVMVTGSSAVWARLL